MLEQFYGGDSASDDLVKAQPLKITRRTTGSASIVALAGVITAVLNEIGSVGLNLPAYGIATVIAAALIAAAIASVGDVLARAYAQAHVVQPTPPPVHVGEYDVSQENGDLKVHHTIATTH